ncbi:MAG TPA: pentapeptide repeat-containing protein [Leptolyngbyaceae cyanobacterium]
MAPTARRSSAPSFESQTTALPRMSGSPVAARKRFLLVRRLVAWGLEVGLLVSSAALPWALGEHIRDSSAAEVPLSPALAVVEDAIARTLNRPKPQSFNQVPPLTNLLWLSALGLPVVVAGSQLYWLASAGKTLPKHWLGLRVITLEGQAPGAVGTIKRELGVRWGLPVLLAYGLWLGGGASPHLTLLGGLTLVTLAGEGATLVLNRSRRAFHDVVAGTQVVVVQGVHIPVKYHPTRARSASKRESPASLSEESAWHTALTIAEEAGGLTSVILAPSEGLPPTRFSWLRQYPALVLGGTMLAGLGLVMVGLVGTRVYTQQQETQRHSQRQSDDMFLALVQTFRATVSHPEEQQVAALALASTQDPRVIPLLVDWLAQTSQPETLETLQQALVTLGPKTLPHLTRLNQSLASDLVTRPLDQRLPLELRQRAVQQTLTKLLTLYSGQLQGHDLSRTFLGHQADQPNRLTLILENLDLAGIKWQGSVLTGVNFRQSRFFAVGPDGRPDTYDDWVTDFSGSDLTAADFANADLRYVTFQGSSLLRATLPNAQAAFADFSKANLGSAQLIRANLSAAHLDGASLVGADLTEAQLPNATLVGARLDQVHGSGVNLKQADLSQVEGREADLSEANLQRANLTAADLQNSRLKAVDLRWANLANANLAGANLQGTKLQGANLAGTNLQNVVFQDTAGSGLDSFIEPLPMMRQSEGALTKVDFSQARNLGSEQLNYICAQGGLHPACPSDP